MTDLLAPLELVDGEFATVEQDTARDRQQRLAAILNTQQGSLDHDPAFGRTTYTFEPGGADPEVVRTDLARIEPDLEFDIVDDEASRTPGHVADNLSIVVPEDE